MSKIRTRYAPSPTGYFHIGGARTALFNYLFAKHYGGDFIVRIEDTDVDRNVSGATDVQLDGLDWLGIIPDESPRNPKEFKPYIQSENFPYFREIGEELVKEGKAYYCFCTSEELEEQRKNALAHGVTPKYNRTCLFLTKEQIDEKLKQKIPYSIRLRIPENKVYTWNDLVRGTISVPSDALTDPIIVKSNGIPTYNFAVVLDDHRMEITHILRGEEHISNTPYQLAIMEALNYDVSKVVFGHLSIIIDETGKKLSKRNNDLKQFIADYKNGGYISNAVTNFIALLGWSPSDNTEINSMSDLISKFDEKRISKAPSFFDIKKMNWLDSEYFKKMSETQYLEFVSKFINVDLSTFMNKDLAITCFKDQIQYAEQINSLIFETFLSFSIENINQILSLNSIDQNTFYQCISVLEEAINNYSVIDVNNANLIVNQVKEKTNLKGKPLFMSIRLIVIGKEHGPEMYKILTVIGKEKIIKNIKEYRASII